MDLGINTTMIFSHILPAILGFFGTILMINGIMDRHKNTAIIGVVIFIIAASSPFIILSIILN
ncbi:MAG: hypothetical protein LBB45_01835 [Methanobrevibacter sp.]|jgi:predicted membrane channel-forming protein YqfA (hemolysin III family)|nr:hypothetical protein [Candidatus Methanovirga basalitermitum]